MNAYEIELSNQILSHIPQENQELLLYKLSTMPADQLAAVLKALDSLGIIVAYDWMPFHRDQWFFPTPLDYDDLVDYCYDMKEY